MKSLGSVLTLEQLALHRQRFTGFSRGLGEFRGLGFRVWGLRGV